MYVDKDMRQHFFEYEPEARAAFARAEGRGWNCHLFQHAPRMVPNAALRPRAEGESSLEGTVIRED